MWRVFCNLFIAAAGAGLLSYPYAVKHQGMLLCVALTGLFGLLNIFTDYVLLQTAYLFREKLGGKGGPGFDSLVLHALGPGQSRLAGASIVLGALGAQIGYLIAIGDLLCPPLQAATRCPGSGPLCALTSRVAVVPAVAFSVTLPLTFFTSPMSLGHSSALAAATVLAVCAVVAAQGFSALAHTPGLAVVGSTAAYPSADSPAALVLSRWTMGVFLGIPISVFSLGNHMQIIPLYLASSPSVQARFPAVVTAAVASCVALYLVTGLLGYCAYRAGTAGDIMLNLPDNSVTAVGKVVLAVHLLLSYPVLFFPSKRSLLAAAGEAAAWLRERQGAAGAEGGGLLARACQYSSTSPIVIPLLATAVSAFLAVAAPSISVVFGLLGATVATYQIYFIPGLLLLKFAEAMEGRGQGTWATAPSVWGRGQEELQQLLAAGEEAGEASSGVALAEPPRPCLLPLGSAALTRALAYLLLLLSVAIGCCGTVVYILSTWFAWG